MTHSKGGITTSITRAYTPNLPKIVQRRASKGVQRTLQGSGCGENQSEVNGGQPAGDPRGAPPPHPGFHTHWSRIERPVPKDPLFFPLPNPYRFASTPVLSSTRPIKKASGQSVRRSHFIRPKTKKRPLLGVKRPNPAIPPVSSIPDSGLSNRSIDAKLNLTPVPLGHTAEVRNGVVSLRAMKRKGLPQFLLSNGGGFLEVLTARRYKGRGHNVCVRPYLIYGRIEWIVGKIDLSKSSWWQSETIAFKAPNEDRGF